MEHLCDIGLQIMRQRIHTRSRRNKGRQVHGQQRVRINDLRQKLGRKEYALTMGIIFRYDRTPPHLAARAAGSRHGNKIRDFLRNILIPADEVVIVEEVPVMMDTQSNGPGHIHGGSAADADDRVPVARLERLAALLHIRLHGVLMDVGKYFHGAHLCLQILYYLFKKSQPRHQRVGHQQGPAKTLRLQMLRQFFYNARSKSNSCREIVLPDGIEICHINTHSY